MVEIFKPKIEEGEPETKTEEFFKKFNPPLWNEISSLPHNEQSKMWLDLTQKHLRKEEAYKKVIYQRKI